MVALRCIFLTKKFFSFSYLQVVKLPRNPNVDDILKKYLDYRLKKDNM